MAASVKKDPISTIIGLLIVAIGFGMFMGYVPEPEVPPAYWWINALSPYIAITFGSVLIFAKDAFIRRVFMLTPKKGKE